MNRNSEHIGTRCKASVYLTFIKKKGGIFTVTAREECIIMLEYRRQGLFTGTFFVARDSSGEPIRDSTEMKIKHPITIEIASEYICPDDELPMFVLPLDELNKYLAKYNSFSRFLRYYIEFEKNEESDSFKRIMEELSTRDAKSPAGDDGVNFDL